MNHELATERRKYEILQGQSQEKLGAQGQEVQALHARMQQTHEQHMAETNSLRIQLEQRGGQMTEGQASLIQHLQEENRQLKEAANAQ